MPPRARGGTISFDLDGTLIHGPFAAVLREISAEVAEVAGPAGRAAGEAAGPAGGAAAEAGVPSAQAVYASFLARHEQLLSRDIYAAYDWISIIGSCAAAYGRTAGFDVVGRLRDKAAAGATQLLHADTVPVLGALREDGWRTAILTNGRRCFQEPILAGTGILAAVDALVTSDDVGTAKPAPAIFAAARAGAQRYLHVGDRLDQDILGARSAGATAVLLRRDAPLNAVTGTLDPAGRALLDEYLLALHRSEDTSADESLPGGLVPDIVAASLAAAVDLIGARG